MSRTILADVSGFTPVIDAVMKDTDLITAVVFGRIWRYCQMQSGVCQATLDKIADGVGLSRQAIIEHIQVLEAKGYVLDTTPDLRNRPHTYKDTGKAGLHIGVSGVNDVDSELSTVNDVDSAVNVVDSHSTPSVLEDSIKRGVKKEVPAFSLSKESLEKANKKVDYILENERKAQESWPGRDRMPEPIRELLDVYVDLTGQKPSKGKLMDWLQTGQEWLELGVIVADMRKAYDKSKEIGFMVGRPGALTNTLAAVAGERHKNHKPAMPKQEYSYVLELDENGRLHEVPA